MLIEETELRDAARQMLTGLGDAEDTALWDAIREAGWTALTVPEALGGLGQPAAAASWLYRELGAALSRAPLLPSLLAIEALLACDASGERDAWIARLAGGERIAASLLAPDDGDMLRAVAGADGADHLLVVRADMVAIVPLSGTKLTRRPTWDESRHLYDVTVAGGKPVAHFSGSDIAARISTHLHFAIAADSIGAADAILGDSVAYLKTRSQFDRPLAMFQALKHRAADLKTATAAADALLADYLAAAPAGDAPTLARAAKALCSSTFRDVAEEAMQFHGGIAMTSEYPCHRYLKRALLNEHLASGNDDCDLETGDALIASVATKA